MPSSAPGGRRLAARQELKKSLLPDAPMFYWVCVNPVERGNEGVGVLFGERGRRPVACDNFARRWGFCSARRAALGGLPVGLLSWPEPGRGIQPVHTAYFPREGVTCLPRLGGLAGALAGRRPCWDALAGGG